MASKKLVGVITKDSKRFKGQLKYYNERESFARKVESNIRELINEAIYSGIKPDKFLTEYIMSVVILDIDDEYIIKRVTYLLSDNTI